MRSISEPEVLVSGRRLGLSLIAAIVARPASGRRPITAWRKQLAGRSELHCHRSLLLPFI